jgi:hypothetical protein
MCTAVLAAHKKEEFQPVQLPPVVALFSVRETNSLSSGSPPKAFHRSPPVVSIPMHNILFCIVLFSGASPAARSRAVYLKLAPILRCFWDVDRERIVCRKQSKLQYPVTSSQFFSK